MYDLLRTEQAFQHLVYVLSDATSARWRLLAANHFLERLDVGAPDAEPYLLDLTQRLPALLHQFDPVGLAPTQLTDSLARFEEASAAAPILHEVAGFDEMLALLRSATATLYAYAGDVHSTLALAAGNTANHEPDWLAACATPDDRRPLDRLQQAAQEATRNDHPVAAVLHAIHDTWQTALHPIRDSTVVPIVERPREGNPGPNLVGGLRRLQIELYDPRDEQDDIRADVQVFGATSTANEVLRPPVEAARRHLGVTHPALAHQFFAGRVRFDAAHHLHEGRSADLAVATLFYSAVLRFTRQREQYRVVPGAAFTGMVDETGTVLPVEETTLDTKVRTAFFSWLHTLAVPASQLAQAQAALQALAATYPYRRLDLVGVSHLREVFYDRRLTAHQRAGLVRHAARKAWQQKFSLASLAIILLLTLAICLAILRVEMAPNETRRPLLCEGGVSRHPPSQQTSRRATVLSLQLRLVPRPPLPGGLHKALA